MCRSLTKSLFILNLTEDQEPRPYYGATGPSLGAPSLIFLIKGAPSVPPGACDPSPGAADPPDWILPLQELVQLVGVFRVLPLRDGGLGGL